MTIDNRVARNQAPPLVGHNTVTSDAALVEAVERHASADTLSSLLALGDEVEVWPGHLGGSLCGSAGIDLKTCSTIGFERRHNRALEFESEAEFYGHCENRIGGAWTMIEGPGWDTAEDAVAWGVNRLGSF